MIMSPKQTKQYIESRLGVQFNDTQVLFFWQFAMEISILLACPFDWVLDELCNTIMEYS